MSFSLTTRLVLSYTGRRLRQAAQQKKVRKNFISNEGKGNLAVMGA
jgi:hypothetical protein